MGTEILSNIATNNNPFDAGATPDSFGDIFGLGINILIGAVIAVSVITTAYSGIKYTMSQGDPKAVDSARKSLTYSVVALVLALGAITIKAVVGNTIGLTGINVTPNF